METKLKYAVIEDSLKVCQGIKERMNDFPEWELCGFAHHIKGAIKIMAECKPDLIFIDYSLKGGSAYEVLSSIAALPQYNPYIIFNTGYQSENPEIPQEIINNYSIDKYLVKPLWENLRLHLPEYLREACKKSGRPIQKPELIWLTDVTRMRHHININRIVCVLQDFGNPHYKTIIIEDAQSFIIKISWEEVIILLERHKINFFTTNSREHIVVKEFIQSYERPYIKLYHFKQKIEVVRNKLAAFEKWMEKP